MEEKVRYTLGKAERLKSRKTIEELFKNGKAFSIFPLRVIYTVAETDKIIKVNKLKTGFSVSTRNFKHAVDRNSIKRLLRETYRLQKNELDAQLKNSDKNWSIFFIYTAKELPDYKTIYDKMHSSIQRLQKIANEGNTATT